MPRPVFDMSSEIGRLQAEIARMKTAAEPARNAIYEKLYDRVQTQDDCISWLLVNLRALQKRVDKLEQHNAHTAANMVRAAAYEHSE